MMSMLNTPGAGQGNTGRVGFNFNPKQATKSIRNGAEDAFETAGSNVPVDAANDTFTPSTPTDASTSDPNSTTASTPAAGDTYTPTTVPADTTGADPYSTDGYSTPSATTADGTAVTDGNSTVPPEKKSNKTRNVLIGAGAAVAALGLGFGGARAGWWGEHAFAMVHDIQKTLQKKPEVLGERLANLESKLAKQDITEDQFDNHSLIQKIRNASLDKTNTETLNQQEDLMRRAKREKVAAEQTGNTQDTISTTKRNGDTKPLNESEAAQHSEQIVSETKADLINTINSDKRLDRDNVISYKSPFKYDPNSSSDNHERLFDEHFELVMPKKKDGSPAITNRAYVITRNAKTPTVDLFSKTANAEKGFTPKGHEMFDKGLCDEKGTFIDSDQINQYDIKIGEPPLVNIEEGPEYGKVIVKGRFVGTPKTQASA
jgi:hypothetical protein